VYLTMLVCCEPGKEWQLQHNPRFTDTHVLTWVTEHAVIASDVTASTDVRRSTLVISKHMRMTRGSP